MTTFSGNTKNSGGDVSITDDRRSAAESLQIGDEAPDFTLPTHNEGELNLHWYRGRKNVVLAFYPGDFTPVCATQVPEYQTMIDRFHQYNAQLLAISVDSVACHTAWARALGGLSFPLMSDYYPHGEVAKKYGVLNEKRGYAERTVFLIDMEGKIRWIERLQPFELPDNEELFRQLAQLQK
jgi:peroxiredoxin (alkyl hydroperoxide reductase subunit C)